MLPGEVVAAPSLEAFRARLDGALIWWGALGWSRVGFKVTSTQPFYEAYNKPYCCLGFVFLLLLLAVLWKNEV